MENGDSPCSGCSHIEGTTIVVGGSWLIATGAVSVLRLYIYILIAIIISAISYLNANIFIYIYIHQMSSYKQKISENLAKIFFNSS